MTSNVLIRFALTIGMLASLVLGPTAIAKPMHAPAAIGMPAHMECCPGKQPASNCSKCLLMALCSTPLAESGVTFRLPSLVARTVRRIALIDEVFHVSRESAPLPEPPRSSV